MSGPRWGRVVAGILLIVVLGLPCILGAVGVSVATTAYDRRHPTAEGRAPGSLTFRADEKRYVVALSAKPDGLFDGLSRTERRQKFRVREGDANEARCAVAHADGTTQRLRGDRQTTSTVVGTTYATVGEFDGRGGLTVVRCSFDPPRDLLGTVTETPLMVHPVHQTLRILFWVLLAAGLVAVGLGVLQILRGTVWRDGTPLRRGDSGPAATA